MRGPRTPVAGKLPGVQRPVRTVTVRDRTTGRYLAAGFAWCADASGALVLDLPAASTLVRRFACERPALEFADADPAAAARPETAVA